MDLLVSSLVPIAASAVTAVVISIGCSKPREDPKKKASQRMKPGQKRIGVKPGSASARTGRSIKSGSRKSASRRSTSQRSKKGAPKSNSKRVSKRSTSSNRHPRKPRSASVRAAKKGASQRSKRSARSSQRSSKDKKSSRSTSSKRKTEKKPTVAALPGINKATADAQKPSVLEAKPSITSFPDKAMKMEPADVRFKPSGDIQHVSIYNTSEKRKAIKVKCSDNTIYRVNPVTAFINAGEAIRLDILRNPGAAKNDKLVVLAAETRDEDTDAKAVIARASLTDQMVLPLIATEAH